MADYNLAGLSARDFEHLTQALAIQYVASGVTPYGDGPDGGREATYRGQMSYPTDSDPWDGYLVIQAKFLTRPSGDVARDAEWAMNQLKLDLAKFADPKRNLPKPDYYLFVTNVVLTPVQSTGSKDKVFNILDEHKGVFGLKGYDVWDFDKLCRLIDGNKDIRCRYAGFITTGDVLGKVIEMLNDQQPEFAQTISLYLQKEMRADQFVKLEQAGTTADQRTPLAQVFVDLPVSNHLLADPPTEDHEPNRLTSDLVKQIIQAGSQVLCNSLITISRHSRGQPQSSVEPGRFVIIGGPGQGKSTVGQFICQLYRASLLNDRPKHTLSVEARSTLGFFNGQCVESQIDLPQARRFPIRIVLDQFATTLANNQAKSLLSYVAKCITDSTESQVSVGDLRKWLKTYPWIIVLDGLDEVPATSNRTQVLEKVTEFWSEVASLDADVLVIATTRPQGYDDDFSPQYYKHLYLVPLSETRALYYARRLVEAQHSSDTKRQQRIMKRLETACQNETTQRLMRSPLQVTIMATLVDRIGQPPQERWRLFRQYYEVIYQRETERDIPASRILQQRKADVNAIHYRVGLLLQTESEYAGTTESKLPLDRFKRLVHDRIAEEGHEGEQLKSRTDEITEAALHRLVFLVGLEADRIGFEIRSFQEFMAAEALMDGKEEKIRARLEAIAPIIHWRNVFLFAAGNCFAERQFHRDMIVTICDQLNDVQNNRLAGITLSGSRLALDILEDGIVREQPRYARSLARIAIKLLEIPDVEANTKLAAVYDPHLEQIFQENIKRSLMQKYLRQRIGSWVVLQFLVGKEIDWAIKLATENWPEDPEDQRLIIESGIGISSKTWAHSRIIDLAPKLGPRRWRMLYRNPPFAMQNHLLDPNQEEDEEEEGIPSWYQALNWSLYRRLRSPRFEIFSKFFIDADIEVGSISYQPLDIPNKARIIPLREIPFLNSDWAPYIAGARFVDDPTSVTLSKELHWLSEVWNPGTDLVSFVGYIPWPLRACLNAVNTKDSLRAFAHQAENGDFGQIDDWRMAEQRWQKQGVTLDDLHHVDEQAWPYDRAIAKIGFPFNSGSPEPFLAEKAPKEKWYMLYEKYEAICPGKAKSWLANALLEFLYEGPRRKSKIEITPSQVLNLLSYSQDRLHYRLEWLEVPKFLDSEWMNLVETIGNMDNVLVPIMRLHVNLRQIVDAYIMNPQRLGLLRFLGSLASTGVRVQVPPNLLEFERIEDKRTMLAALFIRISQGNWSELEARQVASQLSKHGEQMPFLNHWRFPGEVNGLHVTDHELLFLELHDLLQDQVFEQVKLIYDLLNATIRSKTSQLSKPDKWTELCLPELSE